MTDTFCICIKCLHNCTKYSSNFSYETFCNLLLIPLLRYPLLACFLHNSWYRKLYCCWFYWKCTVNIYWNLSCLFSGGKHAACTSLFWPYYYWHVLLLLACFLHNYISSIFILPPTTLFPSLLHTGVPLVCIISKFTFSYFIETYILITWTVCI